MQEYYRSEELDQRKGCSEWWPCKAEWPAEVNFIKALTPGPPGRDENVSLTSTVDYWGFLLVNVDQTDVFLVDVDQLKTWTTAT